MVLGKLDSGACSEIKPILEPTRTSEEAGTQPPVHSCLSSSPARDRQHSAVGWESNVALPTQASFPRDSCVSIAAWARRRGPRLLPQVSISHHLLSLPIWFIREMCGGTARFPLLPARNAGVIRQRWDWLSEWWLDSTFSM